MKVHEDVFDKEWVDQISVGLFHEPWYAKGVANRKTWPFGNKGSHLFFHNTYFNRINDDNITYDKNFKLTDYLIKAFYHLKKISNKQLRLMEIGSNLQFYGMDGTIHKDGSDKETIFILMLSNETINEDIGGEFYHEPSDTKVPFKHGRLIEFNAADSHKGMAFNKPYIARYSIKWRGLQL
jgi:hypothetical protein